MATPSSAPAAMSEGWWAPTGTRASETSRARRITGSLTRGYHAASVTATAKLVAASADGNEAKSLFPTYPIHCSGAGPLT